MGLASHTQRSPQTASLRSIPRFLPSQPQGVVSLFIHTASEVPSLCAARSFSPPVLCPLGGPTNTSALLLCLSAHYAYKQDSQHQILFRAGNGQRCSQRPQVMKCGFSFTPVVFLTRKCLLSNIRYPAIQLCTRKNIYINKSGLFQSR